MHNYIPGRLANVHVDLFVFSKSIPVMSSVYYNLSMYNICYKSAKNAASLSMYNTIFAGSYECCFSCSDGGSFDTGPLSQFLGTLGSNGG